MGVITLTDPVAGTVGDATVIANNNAAIKAAVNGGLDAANFAAGKIFDNTKIVQAGATVGQALIWNGTSWVPGSAAGAVTYRGSGNPLTTVVNSAALADVLNQALAAFAATGIVRFRLKGDYLNNSAANRGLQVQLLLGGTTLIDLTEPSVSVSQATRASFRVEGVIQMADATHAHAELQPRVGSATFATATTGVSTGSEATVGGFGVTSGQVVVSDVTAAPRTLQVRVAHSAANAALDVRIFDWLIEVL